MPKIKLTKGELKKQRDSLKQYKRYLPTLQLKKQQLQMEILHWSHILDENKQNYDSKRSQALSWAGLFQDIDFDIKDWLKPVNVIISSKNIAGVDFPIFENIEFAEVEYDLFLTPHWLDNALEILRELVKVQEEIRLVEKGLVVLQHELRITSQRVNLFEKVKIPETQDAIRKIKIYIGDQMANAVGRSKIAKRKIEESELAGVDV